MTNLLIKEPPLLVLPTLAAKIGLNEAIFLQQLHYWLEITKHRRDGKPWVYNKVSEWAKQFPFWSVPTIRRTINNLRNAGIVEVSDKYNRIPIDKTLWYTIDYSMLSNDQPDHSNDEIVTPCDQSDHSSDQVDHAESSDCASLSDQSDHSNNQRLPENTTETTDREVVGASAPTAPDPESDKTDWDFWLEALCWICHAHKDTTKLSAKDFDILIAEAKRIKELGHAQPALLKSWFTQHWQHDWRWKESAQRPSAYQVRQLLPGYAETVAEQEEIMEEGIRHRNGAKPRPQPPQPTTPAYEDPWAIVVAEIGHQFADGVLERARAEPIGENAEAEIWQVTLDAADWEHYGWLHQQGAVLIRKTLKSILHYAVTVDVVLPESEAA